MARWAQERWFASGYLTGDSYGSNTSTQATSGQTGGVARLAWRPWTDPDSDLHLGLSGSYAFDIRRTGSGQSLQLRDRPEWRIDQTRLIDTGGLPADSAYTWGPEFGLRWRNFLLQGEYIRIGVNQSQSGAAPRPDLGFDGGYVEASWVITGEPRKYVTSGAAFGRPVPAHPFSLDGGGWGAWEAMAALQRRRPERPRDARPAAGGDRRRLWRAAGDRRDGAVLVPEQSAALHAELGHRQRRPAERGRDDADRPALPHHRAAHPAGFLKG